VNRQAKRFLRFFLIPLLIAIVLLCSGCVRMYDPEASQEQNQDIIATVRAGEPFGQTFVARRPRLDQVALQLSIAPDSASVDGTLSVELYHTPGDALPIASQQLSYQKIAASNPVNISLPIQADSAGKSYYLVLKTEQGAIQVRGLLENVYSQGSATANGQPLEADASLRLYYDYNWQTLLSDLGQIASGTWLLLPLALLLFLPGYLALDLLDLEKYFDGTERFALALGFSLAVVPIVMTWTSLLGLHWGSTALWFTAGVLGALWLWRAPHSLIHFKPKISWIALALAGVLLVTLVVRIAMVRDLSAPPWVDSIHHGVITRLIMQDGGFPRTYAPFIDISSAEYHAGFHSLLASFLWLSDLPLLNGMLIFGQILNALAVLAVYLLTVALTGDRLAGVFAALIAGIFTPMPAYYTSWGRYTHLTSLLILPAAFVWVKYLVTNPTLTSTPSREGRHVSPGFWKALLMAGITGGGLFLTHYRVGAFLVCLVLAYLAVRAVTECHWSSLPRDLGVTVLAGIMAMLLVLPWLLPTVQVLLLPRLAQAVRSGPSVFNTFAWTYLTAGLGKYTLILAGLGLVWGLIWGLVRKQWFALTLLLWCGLMFFLSNLNTLGLPGGGFINNTSVQITLFMPIAVLGGFFASRLYNLACGFFSEKWQKVFAWLVAAACLELAVFGARTMLPLLNPLTFLYRQADQAALQWIEANLPEGETVVVNPFSWGYNLFAGSDGGYWISAIAGRETMPPPVLYGLENDPSQVKQTNSITQQVIMQGAQPEALATLLRENGLHYVYIGAKGGPISARLLKESPSFQELYEQDGTWVFRLRDRP
jgi:hypothetical protein